MVLLGIDTSSHNPVSDYPLLARRGVDFNFIKATEATGYVNPDHAAQVAGAHAAGILAGHYHYAQPDQSRPEDEARSFLATIGPLAVGEFVALDLEEGSGNLADWALAWLEAVEAATGVTPFLYNYPNFMDVHGLHDARLARFPLWFASYLGRRDPWPDVPAPWDRITIWQFSDNEDIPGVGHVDGDLFDGTRDQLLNFGKLPDLRAESKPLTPPAPPADDPSGVSESILPDGSVAVTVNFGGLATHIQGVNYADLGVSVVGADGAIYDRSIQGGAFGAWRKRGA